MVQTNYRELPKVIRKYIKSIDKTLQVRQGKGYYTIVEITNNNGDCFTNSQNKNLKEMGFNPGANFALVTVDNFKDYMEEWNLEVPQE